MSRNWMLLVGIILLIGVAFIPLSISKNSIVSSRHSGDTEDVKYGSNSVTIDGVISAGEWTDARTLTINSGNDACTIFFKEDSIDLYIAYQCTQDSIYEVIIDTNNDGGSYPQTDDYLLHSSLDDYEQRGTGGSWTAATNEVGWSTTKGYSKEREFKISYTKLGITSGIQKTIGVFFNIMGDAGTLSWPSAGDYEDPNTWGDLFSSDWWTTGAPPPNEPPILSDNGVVPTWGTTEMDYTFSVNYQDPDNDEPSVNSVFIDDVEYYMTTDDTIYDDGSDFTYTTILSAGTHTYYFLFNDTTDEVRFPEIGTFDGPIVVLPNESPILIPGGIPNGTFFIDEDSGQGEKLIDLEAYFSDDRDDGVLLFEVTYQEEPLKLLADVTSRFFNIEQNEENWFGSLEFAVRAIDKGLDEIADNQDDLVTLSNRFVVTVNNTNDAPVIEKVGPRTVTSGQVIEFVGGSAVKEDQWVNLTIKAGDVDIDTGADEELTFNVNSSLFILEKDDPYYANLSFLPTNDDVGMHHIQIMVEDLSEENDTVDIVIEVENVNDEPYFESVYYQSTEIAIFERTVEFTGLTVAEEESWFNFSVLAKDEDHDIGAEDLLTYSLNVTMPNLQIDKDTGNISFLPAQDDVGYIYLNITVMDNFDSIHDDYLNVVLKVRNINDAPSVPVVNFDSGGETIFEGAYLNMTATASDVDIGYDPDESLSFTWISDIDGQLGTGDKIHLNSLSVGSHNITVTVADHYIGRASYTFSILVKQMPVDNVTDPNGTVEPEKDDKSNIGLFIGIALVTIALIAIVIVILMFLLKKGKGGQEQQPSSDKVPETSPSIPYKEPPSTFPMGQAPPPQQTQPTTESITSQNQVSPSSNTTATQGQ